MDKAKKLGLFKSLLLARVFEEKKIELANELSKTDIGPTSCYGQEAIPVGFCYDLNKDDYVLPSIRSAWPMYLTKGLPLRPIAEEMYGLLKAPVKRVAASNTIVPFSPPMEKYYLPQIDSIISAVKEICLTK